MFGFVLGSAVIFFMFLAAGIYSDYVDSGKTDVDRGTYGEWKKS
jgi:hypothetical protein